MTLASGRKEVDAKTVDGLRKKFRRMMSSLYKEEGASLRIEILSDPAVTDFIDTHSSILDSSFEDTPMSDLMRGRLQESDWIFSGMKTFHELNEAFPSLLNEDGTRKPFNQFLNDVQKVDETYNRRYLNAEYNFANASAEMAGRWERFEEDEDRYLLQYRTQNDGAVRPEHAELHGITLPASDSFWDTYYPPNGWNCRCTVVQVLKGKYQETDHNEAMRLGGEALAKDSKGMFAFNPGKQEKVFPDHNPYTISRCRNCPKTQGNLASGVPDNQLCEACKVNRENFNNKNVGKKDYASRRTELWDIVKRTPTQPAHNSSLKGDILISNGAKKEWLNQPHRHYAEKNELILNINSVIESSRYIGRGPVHNDNPMIKCSHFFETEISGDKSVIIVHEYLDGALRLHGISDNDAK